MRPVEEFHRSPWEQVSDSYPRNPEHRGRVASCPGDQGVEVSCGCIGTGSPLQHLWEQRVGDVSMGWGWSIGKNEPVQGLSYV